MYSFNPIRLIESFSEYEKKVLNRLNRLSFTDISRQYDGIPCKRFLGVTVRGYGQIKFFERMVYVHRLSASLFFDFDIDNYLDICHHCDTKDCWEPTHLFPGTQKDNSQDAAQKGIQSRASHNGHKTHCPHCHEYSPENTMLNKGSRVCRQCDSARKKARRLS